MKNNIGDEARLKHILDAISEIESYTRGIAFEEFAQNSMMKFATIKQLEIIGEAANRISDELKGKYSEIEWRKIVGLRNILITNILAWMRTWSGESLPKIFPS